MQKKLIKNYLSVIIYALFATIFLYALENIFHPKYIFILLQKIVFFVMVPIFLIKKLWFDNNVIWNINKKSVVYWASLWLLWALVVFVAYLLLHNVIDWNSIRVSMESREINSTTFIFVFAYIMFWNSFIEELFFRWFVFRWLLTKSRFLAYTTSAVLFSLYHISIFWTWFKGYILFIAILWLFLGALFFAWLYEKTKWIWSAYIFHILADFVILVIWYIEFFN